MSNAPVALITGAAAGIGQAIGRRLVEDGFRVVADDIDPAALEKAWIAYSPDQVLRVVADVTDPASLDAAVADSMAAFGRLDAVVNNAALHGLPWNNRCLDYDPRQWAAILDVNVIGPVNVVRAAFEPLAASRGVVVNISSMTGYGQGHGSPYAVTKSAVNGLTASLASDLGPHGIRVVGVAPGFAATKIIVDNMTEQQIAAYKGLQTVDDFGSPEGIADVVSFLVSSRARMITGHTVIADLGITRRP